MMQNAGQEGGPINRTETSGVVWIVRDVCRLEDGERYFRRRGATGR